MKKMILMVLFGIFLSVSMISAADLLYFDRNLAAQKCDNGKSIQSSFEKRKEDMEKELREKAQKIRIEGETFEKQAQAGLLKEGAFIKKRTEFAKKMRELERWKTAKEEDLEADFKTELGLLGLELEEEAKKIFKQKGGKVRFGPETVAEFAPEIDITEQVVVAHNKNHGGQKPA